MMITSKREGMDNIAKLVRDRRSVRTYEVRPLSPEDLEKLSSFTERIENPYDIPVGFKFLDGKNQKLKCPVISGTDLFIGAKAPRVPHMEEAVGYSFEMLVLYAQSLGIGTVWVGGTMDRAAFEQAMDLAENERMLCMTPIGYPAQKMSVKESLMRKGVRADSRVPFTSLFYGGGFDKLLAPEQAGVLAQPLELVRWAPSAVNKQPWRAVAGENAVHFYLKHTRGFVSDAAGDMQKIDMGIALCHFALAAEENGLNLQFCINDPGIPTEPDTEYIATYLFQ